jgi:energy-coupling factor transporter transmembrane protein EcfT
MCCLLVSVATITTLRASDLREAVVALPVPAAVSAILLQIVHQTATLAYETRRVASAIAVRGASTGGLTAWRLLSSLPRVWLPRIVQRADRTAAAMELRGYCEPRLEPGERPGWRDGAALALVLFALALAVAARYWSPR